MDEAKIGGVWIVKNVRIRNCSIYEYSPFAIGDEFLTGLIQRGRHDEIFYGCTFSAMQDGAGLGFWRLAGSWKGVSRRMLADGQGYTRYHVFGGSLARVVYPNNSPNDSVAPHFNISGTNANIRPHLPLADIARIQYRPAGEVQSSDQGNGAGEDQPSLILREIGHSLRGFIHSLLGDEVIYLAMLGTLFAVPAGIGGGFILDHYNRKRRKFGWVLLLICAPAGFLLVYLGTTL
jgi:hypothetical protein